MPAPDSSIERALVVGAHPDDIDFGCAGTVATWVDAGIEVTYLVVTRGDQGGFDDTPRERVPLIREAEQVAAAKAVGVTDVRFLDGYADGDVQVGHDLVRDVSRVIRQVRPQRALIQSPERNYRRLPASHPDHLAVGEAALRAIYPAARNAFAYPELLAEGVQPWTVTDIWLVGHPTVDHHVDVTSTFDRKVAALRAHESQTRHLGDGLVTMLRGWLGDNARTAGLPEGRLAEAFHTLEVS
ncbi:MAG: PIG-L deacetylase family protein [Kineosporiaceae bacterium]